MVKNIYIYILLSPSLSETYFVICDGIMINVLVHRYIRLFINTLPNVRMSLSLNSTSSLKLTIVWKEKQYLQKIYQIIYSFFNHTMYPENIYMYFTIL